MPFGIALYGIGKGVEAGMSSAASKDAAKQQREAAIYQAIVARNAFKKGSKNLQPYADIGKAQIAPYQEAINAYAAGIPGYFDQLGKYQTAVDQYNQLGIPGIQQAIEQYKTVAPQYQQAMQNYNAALGRYEGMAGQMGQVANQIGGVASDYQDALNKYYNAAGQYSAALPRLTREYGMEQYKESPFYTPMVTNLAELQATPGYQFQLQQGLQSLGQSAAARGGTLSGAQQKAAQGFAQQQAATGFQDAWQRAQTAYQNALNQDAATKQQISGSLLSNAGLYQTGAGMVGNKAGIYGQQLGALGQQAGVMQNALGGYGQAVNQIAGLGNIYNTGVNQAGNLANAYQAGAGLAGTGANLYGAGMGLMNQNIANRGNALQFGYGATKDIENYRKWANDVLRQSAQDYGTAGAQNALTQGGIWGGLVGSLGGAAGGAIYNAGGIDGLFNTKPALTSGATPAWQSGVANTQDRIGGFADLINSYGGRYP